MMKKSLVVRDVIGKVVFLILIQKSKRRPCDTDMVLASASVKVRLAKDALEVFLMVKA